MDLKVWDSKAESYMDVRAREIELLQDGAIGMYTPQLYMLPGFAQSHAADSTATQSMRHYGHLAADDGRQ